MPYIPIAMRKPYDEGLNKLHEHVGPWRDVLPGSMAYLLYQICGSWLTSNMSYERIALMIGVLDTVKAELQARLIRPYEEQKIEENGDVILDPARKNPAVRKAPILPGLPTLRERL